MQLLSVCRWYETTVCIYQYDAKLFMRYVLHLCGDGVNSLLKALNDAEV